MQSTQWRLGAVGIMYPATIGKHLTTIHSGNWDDTFSAKAKQWPLMIWNRQTLVSCTDLKDEDESHFAFLMKTSPLTKASWRNMKSTSQDDLQSSIKTPGKDTWRWLMLFSASPFQKISKRLEKTFAYAYRKIHDYPIFLGVFRQKLGKLDSDWTWRTADVNIS